MNPHQKSQHIFFFIEIDKLFLKVKWKCQVPSIFFFKRTKLEHLGYDFKTYCESESCSVLSDSLQAPWTIQSMEFSRPEYWIGQLFPSSGDLPNPGIKPRSPALHAYSLPAEPQGKPKKTGVGSLSLLQQIFLTQELNLGFLHCRKTELSGKPQNLLQNCSNQNCATSINTDI